MTVPGSLFVRGLIVLLLVFVRLNAEARQDTADRLWQGSERQWRQQKEKAEPAPLEQQGQGPEGQAPVIDLPPGLKLQQLLFAILNAVNRRDWDAAERWLRLYASIPQHDPALFDFVEAGRAADQGRYREAVAGYKKVLESNPGFTRGRLDLARALYADNRLRDAETSFRALRDMPLPEQVLDHIDDYLGALAQRRRPRLSLSLSAVREDNVNRASTVVDVCALVFHGVCLANRPGKEISASGAYFEGTLNKLWSLPGNHSVLLRSINYGNEYRHGDDYDNLVSTTYLGYQYANARARFQLLPLFEYDREGGREIYQAFGVRAVLARQWRQRTELELSYEHKERDFSSALDSLEGDSRRLSVFANHALRRDLVIYGGLIMHDSDARLDMFAYRERIARFGVYKAVADLATVNLSYSYRKKVAKGRHAVFARRQRDHEGSVYLNITLPRLAWHGVTPALSYEYRDNRSSIAHVYRYKKSRVTFGLNKIF